MEGIRLKVKLEGSKPPVWRKIIVPDKISLADLRDVIIAIFGLDGNERYWFGLPQERKYSIHGPELDGGVYDKHDRFAADLCPLSPYLDDYSWIRYVHGEDTEDRYKVELKGYMDGYAQRTACIEGAKGGELPDSTYETLRSMRFPESDLEYHPTGLKVFQKFTEMFRSVMESIPAEPVPFESEFNPAYESIISRTDKPVLSLMNKLTDKNIRDYTKYLQLDFNDGESKEESVKRIHDFLMDNPYYYLYVFIGKNLENLKTICGGSMPEGFDNHDGTLSIAELLGLMICDVDDGKRINKIIVSKETEPLIDRVVALGGSRVFDKIHKTELNLIHIICEYTVIEVDRLCSMYNEIYDDRMEPIELKRLLYWHSRMLGNVCTFEQRDPEDKNNVVNMASLDDYNWSDFNRILSYRKKHLPRDFDYRKPERDEIDSWIGGITAVYHCWDELFTLMNEFIDLSAEELAPEFEELYYDIVTGEPVNVLVEDMCRRFGWDNPFIRVQAWMVFMGCALDTALPHLKGYSRSEYRELTGEYPKELPVTDVSGPGMKFRISKDTPIYLFPDEIQMELFSLDGGTNGEDDTDRRISTIKSFLGKYPDNLDILVMGINVYTLLGLKDEAFALAKKLGRLEPELRDGLNVALKQADDDFYVEKPGEPVRRNHPKVQPNDPCPCGSGKKFKKCCRGNGRFD